MTTLDGSSDAAPVAGPRPGRARSRWAAAGWYLVLTLLSVIVLFPVYMLLLRAISDPLAYVAEGQPLHPVAVEWDAFTNAFTEASLGRSMALSFVVTLVIVVAQLLTSVLAAYAFAFLEFPFKRVLFAVVIATLLLPIEVTLVANLQTVRDIGLLNSVPGLSVPFLASAFGIFLIRQGFLGIPRDLRDAATLDGYGHLRFLFRVAVPLTRPIIGSFVVISFLGAWNQYVWPRFATTEDSWQTVQVALRSIANDRVDQLNIGFAAAVIAALPLVVLLILFQRQIVRGLTAGAVKG
ncbi:MAG TPA: carbohydrate ABC transporter permease [Microthrixaceae bacterium]|nr:carbohydrate ABC transporter permease [Microthrixaceae bacterium]MCB9375346.1 carbohydrate ABC transporter permease [Microthrixaceae bacterium]MCO5306493.1 carbohydrate ABC transporter permease [Microthrixaceae bacterium]HMU78786.1 carbohydrate ABC transporter permease [Microthrixaceae bacterium]HMV73559.1 carbohydrate ABC transporter permease [Microthrixaceae bacterium]